MAKNSFAIRLVVPDEFYSVLWARRFDDNNCQAVSVDKRKDNSLEVNSYKDVMKSYPALTFNNGINMFYVFPESEAAPEEWFKDSI